MNYTIGKNPCKKCGSKDNFHFYGEGLGGHCFGCSWTLPSDDIKNNHNNEDDEEYEIVGSKFDDEIHKKIKGITGTDSKGYRGLRTDITKPFGVRYEYSQEDGSVVRMMYPCTQDYQLTGYKVRVHPKDFSKPVGETGKACELFGQFKFKTFNHTVLIAGGECDALAAFQMLSDTQKNKNFDPVACVSPTIGESGAHKQIQGQYEFFNQFRKIIVCMDSDEAGRAAAEKIVKVLPRGKVFILEMRLKDPNDYVVKDREKEFISDFWAAKKYVPSGIVGSSSLMGKIKEAAVVPKIPLPLFMFKLQTMMAGGIPLGVLLNLGSASGTGKSTFIDEMVYFWIFHSPHKIGVVSLESDCAQYGTKILSRHISQKIDLIDEVEDKLELLNSEDVHKSSEELFRLEDGSDRFHLIEERDGSLEDMRHLIEQLILTCECKVIILDPIQDLIESESLESQALFLRWIKGVMKEHMVTFIFVNHVRKSSGGSKANSVGAELHEEDFHGSSTIFKSASCNLLFTRDKESLNPLVKNTTRMKCSKMRWTGRTSPLVDEYFYDNDTHTMSSLDDYLKDNPEMLQYLDEEEESEDIKALNRFGGGEK